MSAVSVAHKYRRRTKMMFRKVNSIKDEKQSRSFMIGENSLRLHILGGGGGGGGADNARIS